MANIISPFQNKEARLDPFVEGIVAQWSVEHMDPGETTYSTAGAIHVDGSSAVLIDKKVADRGRAPAPNTNLKLVQHMDGGVYVDATALSRKEIEIRFPPRDSTAHRATFGTEPADFIVAAGVLYPYINNTLGLNPLDVARFNEEQATLRQQFAAYYEEAHGRPYVFTEQEVQAVIAPSAIAVSPPEPAPKLWVPTPRW